MANHKNTLEKFHSKYQKTGRGCWEWIGTYWKSGYGRFTFEGGDFKVHRLSWLLKYGSLNNVDCVLHKCDNRKCLNPDHLFLGSRADNNKDKVSKNRQTKGEEVSSVKITENDVLKIRDLILDSKIIGMLYGISWGHVNKIKGRRVWAHV